MGSRIAIALCVVAAAACGGAPQSETAEASASAQASQTAGGEAAPKEREEEEITGLLGTISQASIQRGIEMRMRAFLGCFSERYNDIEVLGGRFEMSFRIRKDGSVRWVFPASSTIGDRATERCLLKVAQGIRFDRPRGGEAEFTYPLELDPPEEVRPPVEWEPKHVARAVSAQKSGVLDQCRPAGNRRASFDVTLYVAPGGAIMAAGGAVNDQALADSVDCVIEGIRGWEMPDPGSYPAKVSFRLR